MSGRSSAVPFRSVFIDPTGWTGFPLEKITPLLQLKGEVMINFMSDFITRFIDDPRPNIAQGFNDLFGSAWYDEWKALHDFGMTREAAAIRVYTQRLKAAGKYAHVTSTRILKPASDRAYFYLIYATRHRKGVQEFRAVEKTAVAVQERLRNDVKYQAAVSRTGQPSLFGASMQGAVASYEEERKAQLDQALATLVGLLKSRPRGIKFEDSIGPVLGRSLHGKAISSSGCKTCDQSGRSMSPA